MFVFNRWGRGWLVAMLLVAAGAAGCTEKLESGGACPALCPTQDVTILDTTINAVASFDTSVAGFPEQGMGPLLVVASRPDTFVSWAVIRFDTLPSTYRNPDSVRTLTTVRNARIRLRLDTTGVRRSADFVIRAYDVDTTTADDTSMATVQALLRPDRVLGTRTRAITEVSDTLSVPLSDSAISAKVTAKSRLRVLLRIEGAGSAQIRFVSADSATTNTATVRPTLIFLPPADRDTSDTLRALGPLSTTPTAEGLEASDFRDYSIVAQRTSAFPAGTFGVGGMPGTRSVLRFAIPDRFVDSVTVIRAQLILTQLPAESSPDPGDSVTVQPLIALAGSEVIDRDPVRAASLVTRVVATTAGDTVAVAGRRVAPGGGGERSFEVAQLLRFWRRTSSGDQPQALVLQLDREGATGAQVLFHSSESATASARPRLRLQYISRVEFGLP